MTETPKEQRTYHQLHRSFWDRLVDLALAQIANVHIRPSSADAKKRHEKMAIDMRESLEYRFSAVGLHVGLLRQYQTRGLEELAGKFLAGNADGFQTVYTARRQQQMLFDSAIFNILALFDYLGNAIGFSFYGVDAGDAKWKWKRAVQHARDPASEQRRSGGHRYSQSATARIVDEVHRDWINRLEEYRAELIHYKTEPAGGEHSFRFEQGQSPTVRFTITTPPAFTRWVRMPSKERGEGVFIVEAADWLVLQTHASALKIVDELVRELEREPAPPDGGLRVSRKR